MVQNGRNNKSLGLLYNIVQYIKAIQDMREMTHAVFHSVDHFPHILYSLDILYNIV
jgi:hypothetical protein